MRIATEPKTDAAVAAAADTAALPYLLDEQAAKKLRLELIDAGFQSLGKANDFRGQPVSTTARVTARTVVYVREFELIGYDSPMMYANGDVTDQVPTEVTYTEVYHVTGDGDLGVWA